MRTAIEQTMTHDQRSAPYAIAWLLVIATSAGAAQGLPSARPADLGLSSEALARIAPALQAYVDSGKLAGMVAFIARHGKVGYVQAIGSANIESKTPMRTDGVFRIYSMTKPVIAVAIMKLVDQGAVKLDDPVAKFLPAFASTKVYAGGPSSNPTLRNPNRPITIEHLLAHSSGLTYGFFGQTPVDSIYRRSNLLDNSRTVRQFADSIAKLPLVFSPGDAWTYSMSIDVLGAVVEVASKRTLDRYLDEEVFAPLGMRETAFRITPAMEGRIPVLYSRGPDGRLRAAAQLVGAQYQPTSVFLGGGGGLLSTPADYLRFAQMLLNGGELDGRRILSQESVASMMRNHLPAALTPIDSPMIGHSGYGYGLAGAVLVDSAHAPLPGSTGVYRWWGLMGTFFWVDPKADLIGMVWTQFNTGRVYPIEQDFQRLVYAAIQR
ncbi:MAG: serine hydrolase domain-containing protein [Gemmatimonadota bacterium]